VSFSCHHEPDAHPPTPRACTLYDTVPKYRRLWSRVAPAGRGPCVHLEQIVQHCPLGDPMLHGHACAKDHDADRGWVTRRDNCVACEDWCDSALMEELARGLPPPYTPKAGDPPCGVVVGAYHWPALIDLQIRLIRRTCGDVPILVSDDCTSGFPGQDRYARLAAICHAATGVTLWPNVERIGHAGGDVSAFWKGVVWARALGLRAVAKLSQRFLVTSPRWLQAGARGLLESGLPLGSQPCRGREVFPLRTEAVILDVAAWSRPEALAGIAPRRYAREDPRGMSGEQVIALALGRLGGDFWRWPLFGEDRYQAAPGTVWHCSHGPEAYHELAAAFGLALDADFHNDGWVHWATAGTHLYG
jgi:hypothetical protein